MSRPAHPSDASQPIGGIPLRPARADIHLDRIAHNLSVVRRRAAPACVMAVVKADAYGHGAVEVARRLEAEAVDGLAVAMMEEAIELRRAGLRGSILVLGPTYPGQEPLFRRYDLLPMISSLEQLSAWGAWARAQEVQQEVHLKVDTGMTRLGIALDAVGAALEELRSNPFLRLAGVASHLAEAEDLDSRETARQTERFAAAVGPLRAFEQGVPLHLANSAGTLHHPAGRFDLVRAGLALYGHDPARQAAELKPAMEVRAQVALVRNVAAGTRLGYGGRHVTPRATRIAVVPMGYADGYAWSLSNRADALLRGQRVAVLGAVSMDMTLIDASACGAEVGDEVVLMGRQGAEEIPVHELAARSGSMPYEMLCGFGLRLPRYYWDAGEAVAVRSRHGSTS